MRFFTPKDDEELAPIISTDVENYGENAYQNSKSASMGVEIESKKSITTSRVLKATGAGMVGLYALGAMTNSNTKTSFNAKSMGSTYTGSYSTDFCSKPDGWKIIYGDFEYGEETDDSDCALMTNSDDTYDIIQITELDHEDCTVSVDFSWEDSIDRDVGLSIRVDEDEETDAIVAGSGYTCYLATTETDDSAGYEISITLYSGDTELSAESEGVRRVINGGGYYTLEMEAEDEEISCALYSAGGKELLSVSAEDDSYSSGGYRISAEAGDGTVYIANFEISEYTADYEYRTDFCELSEDWVAFTGTWEYAEEMDGIMCSAETSGESDQDILQNTEFNHSDMTVSVDFLWEDSLERNVALSVRIDEDESSTDIGADSGYFCVIVTTTDDEGDYFAWLGLRSDGGDTKMGTDKSETLETGEWYTLTMTAEGEDITCTLEDSDGEDLGSVSGSDSTYTSGGYRVGIIYSSEGIYASKFTIWDYTEA